MNSSKMDAKTGITNIDADSAYSHSFGNLAHKSVYVNAWWDVDSRKDIKTAYDLGYKQVQAKALTTSAGGAGTAGFAMIPIYLDPRVVDTTRKFTPLVELIPRVTNQGMFADFNKITAKGGGITAAEDAALTEANDTYDRVSIPIKFVYAVGRVTGPTRAAQPSYILEGFQSAGSGLGAGNPFTNVNSPNAMQLEVLMKVRSLREKEESLIVNGDLSTTATEFDGIVQLMGSEANVVDKSTTAMDWDDIETAVRNAFDDGGRVTLGVASSSVLQDIRKLMIDTFRYGPADMAVGSNLPFGVSARLVLSTMVGDIPVIPSMYLSNTSGSKAIYFLDMDIVEMRVLQDVTYEDLAKTNDSQKFMLKVYECLLIRNTAFCSGIKAIL